VYVLPPSYLKATITCVLKGFSPTAFASDTEITNPDSRIRVLSSSGRFEEPVNLDNYLLGNCEIAAGGIDNFSAGPEFDVVLTITEADRSKLKVTLCEESGTEKPPQKIKHKNVVQILSGSQARVKNRSTEKCCITYAIIRV
jgi:hypothetical protein